MHNVCANTEGKPALNPPPPPILFVHARDEGGLHLALSKQLTLGLVGVFMPLFCLFTFHLDRWARSDPHVESCRVTSLPGFRLSVCVTRFPVRRRILHESRYVVSRARLRRESGEIPIIILFLKRLEFLRVLIDLVANGACGIAFFGMLLGERSKVLLFQITF